MQYSETHWTDHRSEQIEQQWFAFQPPDWEGQSMCCAKMPFHSIRTVRELRREPTSEEWGLLVTMMRFKIQRDNWQGTSRTLASFSKGRIRNDSCVSTHHCWKNEFIKGDFSLCMNIITTSRGEQHCKTVNDTSINRQLWFSSTARAFKSLVCRYWLNWPLQWPLCL